MPKVQWVGPKPRPSVFRLLEALGAQLVSEPQGAVARVVYQPEPAPVPAPSGAVAWLWAAGKAVAPEDATEAILRGAYDVVNLADATGEQRLGIRLGELFSAEPLPQSAPTFVAESEAARGLLGQIARAARTSQPVLLTGETGTGKEVAAQLVHAWSPRSRGTFVPINCAAIPNELMEGELFGYEKGAFSGAVRAYDGLVAAASGGTVFLDEIDDTPHALQVKLLRVLEDKVVSRLGESAWRKVDFRIIAATNEDLRKLIAAGRFGSDLYERLAIVSIHMPPLRERTADLPALVRHFMARFYKEEPAERARAFVQGVSDEALKALLAYPWPGNIRELRNVIYGSLVYKRAGRELLLSDLPRRVLRRGEELLTSGLLNPDELAARFEAGKMNLRRAHEELDRLALQEALRRAGGNATAAARLLGEVGRGESTDPGGTVRAMMKRLGISSPLRTGSP